MLWRRYHSWADGIRAPLKVGVTPILPGGSPIAVPDAIAEKLNAPTDPETYGCLRRKSYGKAPPVHRHLYRRKRAVGLGFDSGQLRSHPENRHASMYETLCWAMREAKADGR